MFYILAIFIVIAVGMQVLSIRKTEEVHKRTRGVIQSRHDLLSVKEAINLNMKLAIAYIGLSILFVVILAISFLGGTPLSRVALTLFIFGIITLPVGLIGKTYEKKIKSMEVKSEDLEIAKKFEQYLIQWKEPRFRLPD